VGYQVGRRTATQPPTWRQRTRRIALARQAFELVTLLAASQLQRKLQRRMPPRRLGFTRR
jgi:hypothetical protein